MVRNDELSPESGPRFELAFDSDESYLEYLHSIRDHYDYIVLVAETDKRIVGYTIGMILSNPSVFALTRYGFIAEMSVTEEFQHAGVGKQLGIISAAGLSSGWQ